MLTTIQNGFTAGELSPSIWGRTDLAKFHQGAFTMRNMFVNYRGGAASRAGSAYVGTCRQSGAAAPPRDIPFQFSITQGYALEFGDNYMSVKYQGAYVTEAAEAITAATQGVPCILEIPSHGYSPFDRIYIASMEGMTELNGLTWVVSGVLDPNTIEISDLFGFPANTGDFPAYTGGGTASRIYTLPTPYAAVDLPYLKYTQSADTMTLTCVNIDTGTEYPSYELERHGSANWTLTQDTFASAIAAPATLTVSATNESSGGTPTVSTQYSYLVTAVDAVTGEESIASPPGDVTNVDIGVYAGSNSLTWSAVASAGSYNAYKATPAFGGGVPVGSLYGYMGTAFGTQFTDTNITQDFTQVPPTHQDPFAPSPIDAVTITAGGSGYSQGTVGFVITTSTGSGFSGTPIVVGGAIVAMIILNGGTGYADTDTIAFTGGTGATGTLGIGLATGTYPATCAYYQQRRVYAATLNNPDTYFFSQIGAYSNMDSSIPSTDTDAIVGEPWAQQVNGVQFMVPMPGGLVILTGLGAWQLNGGNSAALTPADQDANPQAYNGCNALLPPIVRNYDILYLQEKGSIFRDLSYNFFVNIYTGTDLTVLSDHLFFGYTFLQWASAEEPYKLIWCIRNDGVMLTLTYLKEQDVYAWARHDTLGEYVGVCSVTEPPVDAVYTIVKRHVRGQWMYYSERFDNRIWTNAVDCWCVDAGLALAMPAPAATLSAASATGPGTLTSVVVTTGGVFYTAPQIIAMDPTNSGSGATFSATVVAGVITAVSVLSAGAGYAFGTYLVVQDTTGNGAVLAPVITNDVLFSASASVFADTQVGDVIRMSGGIASVTSIVSDDQVMANITTPITNTVPNDPNNTPAPAAAGEWTITTPVSVVSGLNHLEGQVVQIVADGGVQSAQEVVNGSVTLQNPASAVLCGLGFTAQLQTSFMDVPEQSGTAQNKRKNIYKVTVRAEASRGMAVGTNQQDASALPGGGIAATWGGMQEIKARNALINANQSLPLFTGDSIIDVEGGWDTPGQIAVQQDYPMPANVLAVVAWYQVGDTGG